MFAHTPHEPHHLLLKGADSQVFVPHSRHSGWKIKDIENHPDLHIALDAKEAGACIVMAHEARQIFISGHFEYEADTLANEYFRDLEKGMAIQMPKHYFKDNDPQKGSYFNWRAHANLIFSNWLNYIVYQRTPFDLNELTPI